MQQEKFPRSRFGLPLKFCQSECNWVKTAGRAFCPAEISATIRMIVELNH